MTPLEKAKAEEGRINYCDECEQFQIVGNAAYCKADGKLIHPIMMMRGHGTGPAWNCKKRKSITNYDRVISKTPEELADFLWSIGNNPATGNCYLNGKLIFSCADGNGWLDWLRKEADA